MSNEDNLAHLILHPGIIRVVLSCYCCRRNGHATIYKIFLESLGKARFYCEDCRKYQPNNINIDTSGCPELTGRVVFPTGIVQWIGKDFTHPPTA